MKQKLTLIVGAGLVGANYAKQLLSRGRDVIATVREIEREREVFERRTFGNDVPDRTPSEFAGKPAFCYSGAQGELTLTNLDLFKERIDSLLAATDGSIDRIVNAVNLGTIFGLRALEGELSEQQLFQFCHTYHIALTDYAKSSGQTVRHLLVSTTGSGGIGLERMRISHNMDETGIPPSIILKAKYAAEIRSHFKDFQRSSDGNVVHHAIVPASAIIDTLVYEGAVETYGDYKTLHNAQFMNALTPQVEINGEKTQDTSEQGVLKARFGLFGEDGPHTAADLQQLQLFMGITTATKIAEIIDNVLIGKGTYNYDVLHGGTDIPEQSEYATHSFERLIKNKENGPYMPVTLSPIAPFSIPTYCFAYELLADAGLETLGQVTSCSTSDETVKCLASQVQKILQHQSDRLIASSSLGVSYDLRTNEGTYRAISPIERGKITNNTLREAIEIAKRFDSFRRSSQKLDDFMAAYETINGLPTKQIVGYLAAFPIASQMRKEGHF